MVQNYYKSAIYILIATLLFSILQLCVRLLKGIPVIEIVFFRSIIALGLTYLLLHQKKIKPWGRNKKALVLRGVFGATALFLYFYSIHHLPFSTAIAIHYLNPILTVIISHFVLKEAAKPVQWLCLIVAFLGVLLIKGINTEVHAMGLLAGMLAGVSAASAYNIVRFLKDSESSLVIIFYFPLVTLPLALPWTIHQWVDPTAYQWMLLLAVGGLTQVAQMFLTEAFMGAPASRISIFQYSGLVLAMIYGSLFFNENTSLSMLIGAILIIGSAYFANRSNGPFRGSKQKAEQLENQRPEMGSQSTP